MRKDYDKFDSNYIEGKTLKVGNTVFVKNVANTLNRLANFHFFSPAYNHQSVYGLVKEIKKNSLEIEIIELVDSNLQCQYAEDLLRGKTFNAPKKKCLQWGKDDAEPFARCHWLVK